MCHVAHVCWRKNAKILFIHVCPRLHVITTYDCKLPHGRARAAELWCVRVPLGVRASCVNNTILRVCISLFFAYSSTVDYSSVESRCIMQNKTIKSWRLYYVVYCRQESAVLCIIRINIILYIISYYVLSYPGIHIHVPGSESRVHRATWELMMRSRSVTPDQRSRLDSRK